MKPLHHIFTLLAASMALASCSSDAPSIPADESTRTRIDIEATIGDGLDSRTPKISGFSKGMSFGLFVNRHDRLTPFALNTRNIQVTCNKVVSGNAVWRYSYNGGQYSSDNLYLIRNPKEEFNYTADFFAYYPYVNGPTDISNMRFDSWRDLMYAVQNPTAANRDIEIQGGNKVIDLHFRHLMSRFMFHIRFTGGNYANDSWKNQQTLSSITVTEVDENAPVYQYVYFNAIDGIITPDETTRGTLKYSPNTTIKTFVGEVDSEGNDKYHNVPMCIQPLLDLSSFDDDDVVYRLDFVLETVKILTLDVTKAMLLHDDGTTYGMLPGFTYHFYITMENYVHLDKVFVDHDWITEPEEIKIKI